MQTKAFIDIFLLAAEGKIISHRFIMPLDRWHHNWHDFVCRNLSRFHGLISYCEYDMIPYKNAKKMVGALYYSIYLFLYTYKKCHSDQSFFLFAFLFIMCLSL